jgi:hypothetical protein
MDETPANETPEPGLNKIDLSQLQDFHFGTQWSESKSVPGPRREGERERGPRREGGERGEGRPRGGESGELHRDRRGFRRPAGPPSPTGAPAQREDGPGGPGRPFRESRGGDEASGGRPPMRDEGGERRWTGSRPPQDFRPYFSPYFDVAFYPEDAGFSALVKAMRISCRTFELFEIARLILGKHERFVAVVTRKPPEAKAATETPPENSPADAPPAAAAPARSAGPLFISMPDSIPFETEEVAVAHVIDRHLDKFFDLAVVELEPPKGSFPFVNRCTLSGELLGPPNYHRYQQIVQQHHAAHFARMPFERFRERIETVRDPEVVNQWLEKMKKATRYTWKGAAPVGTPPTETPPAFDTIEEARAYLLSSAKDRMVRTVESARFHAKLIDALPPGEIRRAVEGQLDRQRRFPLDTANALRGRLRREGFTIFKKGAKGVSYVCAVKRKFRVPGQAFSEGIGRLIAFLETNPMILVKELPVKMLGITPPSTPSTPPISLGSTPSIPMGSTPPIPVPTETPPPAAQAEAAPPPAESLLTPEQQETLRRMTMDLRWLVHEGYVTEFADGRLFAPPPMAVARAKAAESDEAGEHDLENFPEVPATPVTPAEPAVVPPPGSPEAPPAESTVPVEAPAPVAAPADAPEPPVEPPAGIDTPVASETAPAPAPAADIPPAVPATEPAPAAPAPAPESSPPAPAPEPPLAAPASESPPAVPAGDPPAPV